MITPWSRTGPTHVGAPFGRGDPPSTSCHVTSCSVSWSELSATCGLCCHVHASQQVGQSTQQSTFRSCHVFCQLGRHIIKIHMFVLQHLMSCNGALSSIIVCRNTTNTSASTNGSPLMPDVVSSNATTCLVEHENLSVNIETLLVRTSCSQFYPCQIRCTGSSRCCFDVQFLIVIRG